MRLPTSILQKSYDTSRRQPISKHELLIKARLDTPYTEISRLNNTINKKKIEVEDELGNEIQELNQRLEE